MALAQKEAEAPQQMLHFKDESGFYPLLSVVHASAPSGQTPILRQRWTRHHLSAVCAMSLEGKLYFHGQARALTSPDVIALLEHLGREVSGRLAIVWDGAPMHRRSIIQEFLTNGAAERPHLEHLPAYAPALHPDEGLWAYLKGVELRHLCCFAVPHLRCERRAAVKHVRRKPRIITRCFQGADL